MRHAASEPQFQVEDLEGAFDESAANTTMFPHSQSFSLGLSLTSLRKKIMYRYLRFFTSILQFLVQKTFKFTIIGKKVLSERSHTHKIVCTHNYTVYRVNFTSFYSEFVFLHFQTVLFRLKICLVILSCVFKEIIWAIWICPVFSSPIDNEGESGKNKRGQIFPSIQLITNFLHSGFVFKVMTTMRM